LGQDEKATVPSKANTTTVATVVPKNTSRADFARKEAIGQLMFVEITRNVRDVEVSVLLIRKLLELRVERFLRS
jgi:hypothetical protein